MSKTFKFDIHKSLAGSTSAERRGTVSISSTRADQHESNNARHGHKRVIETPGCFMFSTKGSVPHLTPDNMRLQDFGGINVSLEQLLQTDQPASFSKWPSTSPNNSSSKFTLADYLHLQDLILMCDLRDYSSFSPFANPSPATSSDTSTKLGPNTDRHVLLSTPKGTRQLTLDDYLQVVRQYRPDIMVALTDNIAEKTKNLSNGPPEKRVRKSVERSLRWLDQILLERQGQDGRIEDRKVEEEKRRRKERKEKKKQVANQHGEQISNKETQGDQVQTKEEAEAAVVVEVIPTEPWKNVAVFAHVLGAQFEEERIRSAEETAKREGVDGFIIDTSSIAETVDDTEKILKLVQTSMEHLPSQKPKLVYGVQTPEDVLKAIALGVDLFDTSYPYHLTEDGKASLYCFGQEPCPESVSAANSGNNRWINLWDEEHGDKFVPIMEGCKCYACKDGRHTRAYINHLLKTHEMLATVLLMSNVRKSIHEGTFDKHSKLFRETFGTEPKRTGEKHEAQLVVEAALTKRNQRLEGPEEGGVEAIAVDKNVKKRPEVEIVEADKTKKAKKQSEVQQ
ncbi:Queuine tRNA-ribosyltransferase subunit qtrtd1 [Mortierella sp. GBA30]|nr:Queuine tRNA-ribosyltransferase subunit qtrtd1 [Mortierella sp. GBA30]